VNNAFYEIAWFPDVVVSLSLILLSLGLLKWFKIGLEKLLLLGTLRTFLQLAFMGYVLTFFFNQQHWSFMVILVLVMTLIASWEGYHRQKEHAIPGYFLIIFVSLLVTVIIVLGAILGFILRTKPWYYPYAMIPLAGMVIGNALTSITLSVNRFLGEMEHRENEIETFLALGAPFKAVVEAPMRVAIKAALLPAINSMMMVGLVQLPGVMTGQILAGVDPLVAIRYQIMIMYMWVTTATLADILVLALVSRKVITPKLQLRKDLIRSKT